MIGHGVTLGRATVSDQVKRLPPEWGQPVAAVNGDLYNNHPDHPGDPEGLQILHGELVSAPSAIRVCFWLDANGNPHRDDVRSRFQVTWPDGRTTPLGLNEARADDAVVLYTAAVGATTRAGLLSLPLTGRFGITHRLDFYDAEALATIVTRSSAILGCPVEPAGAREIARRSRGTPRIANRLLRRVRDYAEVAGESAITEASAEVALDKLEVDQHGLDEIDRRILTLVIERFSGGPVGLSALAHSLGEDKGTLEDLYEPFLLQSGFLQRTPKGRVASALAYRHLGLKPADVETVVFPDSAGAAALPRLLRA